MESREFMALMAAMGCQVLLVGGISAREKERVSDIIEGQTSTHVTERRESLFVVQSRKVKEEELAYKCSREPLIKTAKTRSSFAQFELSCAAETRKYRDFLPLSEERRGNHV